jgi:hypothetical protein
MLSVYGRENACPGGLGGGLIQKDFAVSTEWGIPELDAVRGMLR